MPPGFLAIVFMLSPFARPIPCAIDLSGPGDPEIVGALEIPGFSDYLHPLPDRMLLGIGMDAVQSGPFTLFQGLQVVLFDVSGDTPLPLQKLNLGRRGCASAVLRNHHAFSVLEHAGRYQFAFPARLHDADADTPPVVDPSFFYPHAASGLLRFELTGHGPVDAQLRPLAPLFSLHRSRGFEYDDATASARSVLFADSVVYVDRGRFFWMRDDGSAAQGPL